MEVIEDSHLQKGISLKKYFSSNSSASVAPLARVWTRAYFQRKYCRRWFIIKIFLRQTPGDGCRTPGEASQVRGRLTKCGGRVPECGGWLPMNGGGCLFPGKAFLVAGDISRERGNCPFQLRDAFLKYPGNDMYGFPALPAFHYHCTNQSWNLESSAFLIHLCCFLYSYHSSSATANATTNKHFKKKST